MIQIKRVYEKPSAKDGYRVLVDRLWPRGKKKSEVPFDDWMKELSPSNDLRKEFGHDPEKWKKFKSAYLKELRGQDLKESLACLIKLAKRKKVTLLYAAHDEEHNNAVVLKQFIEKRL